MAEPVENKGDLTDKLEADRQKMATQVTELQQSYSVPRWFRASVRKYPRGWILGAVIFGFLLSRVPARKKEVYVWLPGRDASTRDIEGASIQAKKGKKVKNVAWEEGRYREKEKRGSSLVFKVWSLIKPILAAYLAREIYSRLSRFRSNLSTM
ncbi:MAG: hypothetical protein JOZ31_23545 [Verrucomicrobia bacterium]|nr:hypothetical protein [Verrucomicrobiota bacterium]MBV8485752.1 hypothetical protein [Verrucomicrobiota bacterium]